MTRSLLAATTALTLMAGIAVAQTTETTTTTTVPAPVVVPVVPVVPAAPTSVVDTMRQRTIDQNGVVTEQTRTTSQGVATSPYGDTTTTRKTTETHTVR
jgi:hypothetical protein